MATVDPASAGTPSQPINPEDDAALQAIEALEARSVDLDPQPYIPSAKPRPIVPPAPVVIPAPIVVPVPVVTPSAPITPKPVPPIPPKPSIPKTPAVEIAEALANAPPTSPEDAPFQPFPRRRPSKKSLLIIVGVILIIGLIAGGYFGWHSLHSS